MTNELRQQENDCQPLHTVHGAVLSLVVTVVFVILAMSMPAFTAFLGPALFMTVLVAAFFSDHGGFRLASRLDAFSRGRLIAMLAAVALYRPPPPALVLFLIHHPLRMFDAGRVLGLWPSLAFALLASVQTGMALAALLTACPAVTTALLRVAGVLPAAPARWLRRRILLAQRRLERISQ